MTRRRIFAAAALVAVLAAAGAGYVVLGGDGDSGLGREGSRTVDGDGPLRIDEQPAGYRIEYRIRDSAAVSTEVVEVRRPFDARTTTYRGENTRGEPVSVQRSAFGRVDTGGDGGGQVLAVGPSVAGPDLRLAPAVDDAIERGWLDRREVREVAGRRCQVYRFGTSAIGGVLAPPADREAEYADACFDASGLLLEEWWVVEGEPIRHRVAVEVDEVDEVDAGGRDDVTDDLASTPPSIDIDHGGGSILELQEGSAPPGAFFQLDGAPDGFEHLGRYSVIPPQPEAFTDPDRRGTIVASTADVWVRGIDVLVVDQGGTLEQQRVFEPDPDNPTVHIGDVGEGELIIGLGGNEVRILRPAGRFVRVQGTLPVDDLVAIARSLVETTGTQIVVKDG